MDPHVHRSCVVCSAVSTKKCASCKTAYYCGAAHQKEDWPHHKRICAGRAAPEPEGPGQRCTRCLNVPEGQCTIAHPENLVTNVSTMYIYGKTTQTMSCDACKKSFKQVVSSTDADPVTFEPADARWCFKGDHTTKPLKKADQRRVYKDMLVLHPSATLQTQIHDIPNVCAHVRVVRIASPICYDDTVQLRLRVPMPCLEELQLIDCKFAEIVLNSQLTPKLAVIEFQNVDDCELEVVLPQLRSATIYHWGPGEEEWVDAMLAAATELVLFDSYKFRAQEMVFASSSLRHIRLHRAELLTDLTVYAPNLETLDLGACYGLEEIVLADTHPNRSQNPNGKLTKFDCIITNACLSDGAKRYLKRHPRVKLIE